MGLFFFFFFFEVQKGIDLLIAGGMGTRSIELLNVRRIQVVIGASGEADVVIAD